MDALRDYLIRHGLLPKNATYDFKIDLAPKWKPIMLVKDDESLYVMSGCDVPPSGCLIILTSQRFHGKQLIVNESLTYVPQAVLCPVGNGMFTLEQKFQEEVKARLRQEADHIAEAKASEIVQAIENHCSSPAAAAFNDGTACMKCGKTFAPEQLKSVRWRIKGTDRFLKARLFTCQECLQKHFNDWRA